MQSSNVYICDVYIFKSKFTLINTEEFTERLKKVIHFYGETATSFAEKIGVQRSSISHILSGRNKPSLDFIMKVLHTYPEVELYWLLNGKGNFPSDSKEEPPIPQQSVEIESDNSQSPINFNDKDIDQIVIFYKDGSFKTYKN